MEQTTLGVSRAVAQRIAQLKLARQGQRAWVPTAAALAVAALSDLPRDVDGLIRLVEEAPSAAFEGGRAQLSLRVPAPIAETARRVPLLLRAAGTQGTLAWQILAAAYDRQLDAEAAPLSTLEVQRAQSVEEALWTLERAVNPRR